MIPKSYQRTEEEGGREEEGGGEGEGGGGGEGGEDVHAKEQEESEDTERGEEDGAAASETKEIDEHKVEVAKQMAVVQYHRVSH